MIADYHMHTSFSTDSTAKPEDYIQKAISMGMNEICFTDHVDLDYPVDENGQPQFKLDADAYYDSMTALRDRYEGKIKIKIGLEVGASHNYLKDNQKFVASHPFDFIIASTHTVHDIDPYYPAFWEGRSVNEAIHDYYETCLRNVTDNNDYDVFGHLDYIRRYIPDKSYVYTDKEFYEITEKILKNIVAKGHGIELNTRGLRSGVTDFIPMITILKRFREMGGEIVTVGSDAHDITGFAYAFRSAAEILENVGFHYVASYENRVPTFMPIR